MQTDHCVYRPASRRRRPAVWLTLWWTLFASPAALADTQPSLEIGVAPYLPTPQLVSNFQPLRHYLEDQLRRPVTIVTAPDYRYFNERLRRHDYPLIIAVANSAYLAFKESGYVPMLRPRHNTRPVLVVIGGGKWAGLEQLRNQTVAVPDPLAVISMQADQVLRAAGLEPGHNITVRHVANHATAIRLVATGEVAAAFVSDRAILQMSVETHRQVRVVRTWDEYAVPGVIYLASPNLPPEQVSRLRQAIAAFANSDPIGRQLMKEWGYRGLVAVRVEDMEQLAPYGRRLKAMLEERPVVHVAP
jgi:phosphonate transport system substrate-binding protein